MSRLRHDHARDASGDTAIAGVARGAEPTLRALREDGGQMASADVGRGSEDRPQTVRSTVLSDAEAAIIVAFRRHTLLPLDDCLWALQATIPHLSRSSLHRCFTRHGISRLPELDGDKPTRKRFKPYPLGHVHIDLAELRTAEGKLHLFIAIDGQETIDPTPERDASSRPQRRPDVEVRLRRARRSGHDADCHSFPRSLGGRRSLPHPHRAHRQRQSVRRPAQKSAGLYRDAPAPSVRPGLRRAWHRAQAHTSQSSQDQRASRANEPHDQTRHRQAISSRRPPTTAPAARQLRQRLQCRPSTEGAQGSALCELICHRWQTQPERFNPNPVHQMPGLNELGSSNTAFLLAAARLADGPLCGVPNRGQSNLTTSPETMKAGRLAASIASLRGHRFSAA